jgi:hypothetical protein
MQQTPNSMLQRHACAWKKEKDMILPRKRNITAGDFSATPPIAGQKQVVDWR